MRGFGASGERQKRGWNLSREVRHLLFLLMDLIIISISLALSLFLLNSGRLPQGALDSLAYLLAAAVIVKVSFLLALRFYDISLSTFGIFEAVSLFKATLGGELVFLSLVLLGKSLLLLQDVDLFIIPVDFAISLLLFGSVRISLRLYHVSRDLTQGEKERVLIVGTSPEAINFTKQMYEENGSLNKKPVGFIQLRGQDTGLRIFGLPVFASLSNLEEAIAKTRATEIVVAKSEASGHMREIAKRARKAGVRRVSVLPSLIEILSGRMDFSKGARSLRIEDLLSREPVQVNLHSLRKRFKGKTVLITGAAGSIGSELTWQIIRLGARRIILLDQEETNLFELFLSLKDSFPHKEIVPYLANILDEERIREIFGEEKLDFVFHAAAYKHVPFLEWNPGEAVKTNIQGTWNLARSAIDAGVEKFVFISTDKAVNPSSVMGATKRITEMLLLHLNGGGTKFITVRFGNVLGSRGSVIEIFRKQIEEGGPVTVTHPEMKRYFMTVSEAVLLVLEAALMGKGAEVFVLDMGEPVRIVDLAREMIELVGFEPEREIPIIFVGLRPGEKLYEEVLTGDEGIQRTSHRRIHRARLSFSNSGKDGDGFFKRLELLISSARRGKKDMVLDLLEELVPEYTPERLSTPLLSHTKRSNPGKTLEKRGESQKRFR